MSLLNLSRTTSRASTINAEPVTADTFIEDALNYAQGRPAHADSQTQLVTSASKVSNDASMQPMRRATFTLTEECIVQLQEISDHSGVAKSKLIRLWIAHFAHTRSDW